MNIAIILAAGKSTRFGSDKPLVPIYGKPMVLCSFDAFRPLVSKIIVAANKKNTGKIKKILPKNTQIILGGHTRQKSVHNVIKFLKKLAKPDDIILIHNVANPFVTQKEIVDCIRLVKKHGACVVGNLASDTVKIIDGNFIKQTLPREKILLAQTPQGFKWKILLKAQNNRAAAATAHAAYTRIATPSVTATDDASLVESLGQKVAWTSGSPQNKKLTFQEDLTPDYRIGAASDYHEFSNSGTLILAGIKFPRHKKLLADSDGDAILHALSAAISQALGGGSLGTFATAMCKRGIKDSKKYLAHILKKMNKAGYEISNTGIHIETQKIRIDPIAPKIKNSLSHLLKIPAKNIGITANSSLKKGIKSTTCVTIKPV